MVSSNIAQHKGVSQYAASQSWTWWWWQYSAHREPASNTTHAARPQRGSHVSCTPPRSRTFLRCSASIRMSNYAHQHTWTNHAFDHEHRKLQTFTDPSTPASKVRNVYQCISAASAAFICGVIPPGHACAGDKCIIASGSHDSTVRLWPFCYEKPLATKHSSAVMRGHGGSITCLAACPGNVLYATRLCRYHRYNVLSIHVYIRINGAATRKRSVRNGKTCYPSQVPVEI